MQVMYYVLVSYVVFELQGADLTCFYYQVLHFSFVSHW